MISSGARLRVLIVEPAGLLWGSERALLDLLAHIDRERFEVTVACPSGSPLREELERRQIPTAEAPLELLHVRGRWARVRAAIALALVMRRNAPRVVHVNQAGLLRIAAVACRLMGTPLICHIRLLEDARRLHNRQPRLMGAQQYIAISDAVRATLNGVGRLGSSPVSRIYDPLDEGSENAKADERRPADLRAEFRIPPHSHIVALVGRVCADKQQELLIEAASILGHEDIRYLIVGGEPPHVANGVSYLAFLERRTAELGLQEKIIFTGMRSDVAAIMRMSDVVVLASPEEALGRVLLEALSLSKPIIGPAGGGPAEIIGANERGLAFDVGSATSLASCIRVTFADAKAASARTERGRTWVRESCAPEHHAREVERAYLKVSMFGTRPSAAEPV
jgi:glycosyltransferase involved in cell wall biosynthesis